MAKFLQGKFTPTHPEKYVGDVNNIRYRSSWEKKAFIWLDTTENILKWASEEVIIRYVSPVDNKVHRYFTDIAMQYRTTDGTIKNALIEIKPEAQTMMPKKPTRQTKRYIEEVKTYAVNQAKWKAAELWAKEKGFEFTILTERHLFGK